MADLPSSNAPVIAAIMPKKLRLQARDGHIIAVDLDVAVKSKILQRMIIDLGITNAYDKCLDEPVPLTNIDGAILYKLMIYCDQYKNVAYVSNEDSVSNRIVLTPWEEAFTNVPVTELTALIMGAHYLDIPGAIDITSQKVANLADNKSVEELREFFNIENDFTPKEEEEVHNRFEWLLNPETKK